MKDNRVHELLTGLTVVLQRNGIGADGGGAPKQSLKTTDESEVLASNSPQVIIYTRSVDNNYCPTFMSDNVVFQLGYPSEKFTQDPAFWTEHIHSEDVEAVLSGFSTLSEVGHHVHEYRFRHKDGTFRWMRDELNLMRDTTGRPYEILGSWTDVTEGRRIEKALRESEARYRSLVNNAPVGMVSFDTRGEITEFNPALVT
ncbi:MAG: PAS domain-containing protein, partial [Bacteroidetes bacterium]|nr:PAS domain-containing protein [Bacteroidota bacterium]